MKKILSFLSIALLLNNIFVFSVFAWLQIDFQLFQIRINNWTNYTWDVEVKPWDKLSILLSWQNKWDPISNPKFEMSFSANNFTYDNSSLKTYNNSSVVNSNIPLTTFNPWIINSLPIDTFVWTGAYMDAYYVNLFINQDASENVLTIVSEMTADWTISNQISRNVFINSNPHIIDYYFENSGVKMNQIARNWADSLDLVVKVKDYNWCDNIDNAEVNANLSWLWLSSSENLFFVSCSDNTAIYKKSWIITLAFPKTLNFTYDYFSVTDESWNINKPNDPETSFDNEDMKSNLSLEIVSAGTPEIIIQNTDNYIWWLTNLTTNIDFTWNQDGEYKVTLWNDWVCNWWVTLVDWISYSWSTENTFTVNSDDLLLWDNSIFVCLKNDENLIWSSNINIIKDIEKPIISTVSVWPANVVLDNATAHFTCSEDGDFRIEKWWTWTLNSWVLIWTWNVVSNVLNDFTIQNSDIDVYSNDFNLFCIDKAENFSTSKITVNKTTPPPSFESSLISFVDNDSDYDWLDWRDISITWDETLWINYDFFEAYKVFILPTGTSLDFENHNYLIYDTNNNSNSFIWTELLTKDSAWNNFISGALYTACVSIIWTNWINSTPGCINTILTWDTVNHATILSAKFKENDILEITTDTQLDSDILNHDASLISYKIGWDSLSWISIHSIDWKKINITIPSLNWTDAVWLNLLVLEWAIRSNWGWFNTEQTLNSITDWQVPVISNFTNNSTPIYWNFYNWNIEFSFKFSEAMKNLYTKFEIVRVSWNPDSVTHYENITSDNLSIWSHTKIFDLDSLWLVSWTVYQIRLVWQDVAWNYNSSDYLYNIWYDKTWAAKIVQDIVSLYPTLTPNLTWKTPLDNLWNGSWIKNYAITVYNWNNCTWTENQSKSSNTNSLLINTVSDIANYSWVVNSTDNMWNIWIVSDCNNFRVDTSVPSFSSFQIKDLTLNSTSYIQKWNTIEVSSTITDTDKYHIWCDLSLITWLSTNSNELCSAPSAWITCNYTWNKVIYSLTATNWLSDWTKQAAFNVQNTSWGNDVQQILSITADSNSPLLAIDTITWPVWLVWWTWTLITWIPSKITDAIWVNHLKIEYSTWAWIWVNIWSWANNGIMNWNLSWVSSWTDYKIRITAFDWAWNFDSVESSIFEVDTTNPIVPSNTIITPNGWENFWSTWTKLIKWASGSIIDSSLKTNPIDLFYSSNSWADWTLIAKWLPNNGSYLWNHWNLNTQNTLIKLVATDKVENYSTDISNFSFVIDTISPTLSFDFDSTPSDWSYINNSSFDILWNTSDIHLKTVYYSFINSTTGEYFNWNIFTWTTEIYNSICSDSVVNWTNNSCNLINYNLSSNIIDWNTYKLKLKSIDEAWNETITSSVNYVWDNLNPIIWIDTPNLKYFKDSILIEWTSSDLWSWISSVKIQIKKGNDYWDWTDFVSSEQTLVTQTNDEYNTWSYDFSYNWDDWDYEVIAIAYDKSFKVNNISEVNITVIKDSTKPIIDWWIWLFTSPLLWDIYIGWDDIWVLWNSWAISDLWAWLNTNPITLEYLDWSNWILISENETNDGEFTWSSEFLDSNNVKIRLSVKDKVDNISYQSSSSFIIDSTPPSISSVETMDLDANWQIDALNIHMSENIKDSSIILWDFIISNGIWIPTSLETWNSINDDSFILKFNNIWDTSLVPSISYTKWSLVDIAWKFMETDNYTLALDKASPRLLNSEIFDTDWNWKFDKIVSNFSENLSFSSDTIAFDIANALAWISINSINTSWNIVEIHLNEWDNFNTSVWPMSLDFTSNLNWKDMSNNQAWSIVNWLISDKAKPVAYKTEYFDINSNYKVDRVSVSFSENILQFNDSDFSISWLIKWSWSLLWNVINFEIAETIEDNDTWVSANLSFSSWNLTDSSGNLTNSITGLSIEDRVIPKLLSIETDDSDWNGKIDNLILKYSENINSDFSTLIWNVDLYNITWYSKWLNNELLLEVDEKELHDSWATPFVNILSNSSLTDLNENLVDTFSSTASIDKVWPVVIWARYDESTHKVFITSSEPLNSATYLWTNFVLSNAWSHSITWVNFLEQSITLSWENVDFWTTSISFKSDSIEDLHGNKQLTTSYVKLSPPIIINEIMLSDDSNNNYIELKNLSSNSVDISWYSIAWITIPMTSSIPWNGFYLIAKNTELNSILNISPDLVDNNLDISWSQLILNDWNIDVDFASLTTWLFDATTPKSIERKKNVTDWLNAFSWYTAQDSIWFDNIDVLGTPWSSNIYDNTAPAISSFTPSDNLLLPTWNFDISFVYEDNTWWIWVNTSTESISLTKWDWTSWETDISSTYIDLSSKNISSTEANYKVNSLPYWKYKINFSISDKVGNRVNKIIIFYVDEFSFSLNTNNVDIWKLISWISKFSNNELVITIETVGAWFSLDMLKNWPMSNSWTYLTDYDWNFWFWYDQFTTWYSWMINSIWSVANIITEQSNINPNWEKNTYTYRIKYWAKVDVTQWAWYYSIKPSLNVNSIY